MNDQAPLPKHGESDEIQRQEKGDGVKRDASLSSRHHPTAGKKFHRAMGKDQRKEGEYQATGLEAPGQQKTRGENRIIIEADGGGGNRPECTLENHSGGEQECTSGQYQRLERSWAPD